MQRCFFFLQPFVGTALVELREIREENSESDTFFCAYFNVHWCMNEGKSIRLFFPSLSIVCCNFIIWQLNGIEQIILYTVNHCCYFSALSCVSFKIHKSVQTLSFSLPFSSSGRPILFSCHIPPGALCGDVESRLAVLFLWSSISGYTEYVRADSL